MLLHELHIILRFLRLKFGKFFRNNAFSNMHQDLLEARRNNSRTQEQQLKHAQEQASPAISTIQQPALEPEPQQALELQPSPAQTVPEKPSDEARISSLEKRFLAKLGAREARQQKIQQEKNAERPNALKASERDDAQAQLDMPQPDPQPTDDTQQPVPEPAPLPIPSFEHYELPPLELLNLENIIAEEDTQDIERQRKAIQDTLDSFYIDAEVSGYTHGPRITSFQITVAKGIRVTAISNIANDLCMALEASQIRILAPVPGHDYVGIEVPNKTPSIVQSGASIAAPSFANHKGLLPVILGRDVQGKDIVFDLAKAPHLLVAGATGSGKSVCLNNILISLLYRFKPDELKLILVDPKVVEFSIYKDIPHLIVPVITDVDLVILALHWVIDEMQRRFTLLAKAGVRHLEAFNARPPSETPILDDAGKPIPDKLPFIVVIIDELADIMLTAKQDVETSLARIAQLARAVGIHCIVATQRPSVNVITGVIKANIPTRIAFQVSSQVDSRTIIDGKGAESLLGKGDMLFKSADAFRMQRLQGAMISDHEIENVVAFCGQQAPHPETFDLIKSAENSSQKDDYDVADHELDDPAGDSLVRAAIEVIIRDQKASISYVQRRLKIGYNKAASIMEILEKRGVVGPQIGSAPREIIAESIEEAMADDDY